MSTNPCSESSKGSSVRGSSRAGDSWRNRQQDEVAEALVAVELNQSGREVIHQATRDFLSFAPQDDSAAVDPSSGQAVLGGPNSQAPSTPVSVVEDEGNAMLLFDGGQGYKLLGEANGPGKGIFISCLDAGKSMMRYPPKEHHVFTEDMLLGDPEVRAR